MFSEKLKRSMKLLLLLTTFLSCASPKIHAPTANTEQCTAFISLEVENGRRYIDEKDSACICRLYRFSEGYIGPIGTSYKTDISNCHKNIGHPIESYERVNNFLQILTK